MGVITVIILSVFGFGLRLLLAFQHGKVLAPFGDAIFSVIYIAYMMLFAHFGWFVVVKRKGCCGKIGYLVWAIVLLLCSLGPIMNHHFLNPQAVDIVYVIMIVPIFYMMFACVTLFNQRKSDFHLPQLLSVN